MKEIYKKIKDKLSFYEREHYRLESFISGLLNEIKEKKEKLDEIYNFNNYYELLNLVHELERTEKVLSLFEEMEYENNRDHA